MVTFSVPIGYYYNRRPNPYTGIAGDATFPRHIFLTSYSLRLGGRGTPATDQPLAPPASEPPSPEAPGAVSPQSGAQPADPPVSSLVAPRPEVCPAG
jgi:hypothetical protein